MSTISPLENLNKLKQAVTWMLQTITSYENGITSKKEIAHLAKRAQKKVESYKPNDLEKEHKEAVLDLCISLSTIDRAEGKFENFYINSLHDELEKASSILGVGDNE
ncbi:MAG: hypothetical protein GOP50_01110 [Candidatus Heimdallarchaeota archaeon]|nr:hypothetical protein [Candidatus Heimdallarchaeota archaeon]